MAAPKRQATLKDIAAKLGISYQAVAATLSESPRQTSRVSPATAERIRRTARQIGYRRSLGAQIIRSAHPKQIGLVLDRRSTHQIPDIKMRYLVGAERALAEADWRLSLVTDDFDGLSAADLPRYVREYEHAGFLLFSKSERADRALASVLGEYRIPYFILNGSQDDHKAFTTQDTKGAALLVERLVELGHRRLLFCGIDRSAHSGANRYLGYARAMEAAGLEPDALWLDEPPNLAGPQLSPGERRLLEAVRERRPTALVCKNDSLAWKANRILQQNGYRAPRDISLAGTNDLPGTNHCLPPLTTIRYDFEKLGAMAARALLAAIADPEAPTPPRLLEPVLVERESTARPPEEKG